MTFKTFAIAAAFVSGAASAPAYAATDLTGQSVSASFTSNVGANDLVQFASPQVVGGGVEFTGSFTDLFSQGWTLALDFNATGFTLGITGSTDFANVQSGLPDGLTINLGNLSGIGPLTLASYTCNPVGSFACGTFGGGPNLTGSGSDATSAFFSIRTLRTGETYAFSLAQGLVPEPSTWALMILGFGIVGGSMRQNRTKLAFA